MKLMIWQKRVVIRKPTFVIVEENILKAIAKFITNIISRTLKIKKAFLSKNIWVLRDIRTLVTVYDFSSWEKIILDRMNLGNKMMTKWWDRNCFFTRNHKTLFFNVKDDKRKITCLEISQTYFSFRILFQRLLECIPLVSRSSKVSHQTVQVGNDGGAEWRRLTAAGAISQFIL